MDITEILNAAVTLIAALVSTFVIPWLRERCNAQQVERLMLWAEIAVAAAEQLYGDLDGEKKRQYVLDFLNSRGCKLDGEAVEKALEAAVLRLHHQLKGAA